MLHAIGADAGVTGSLDAYVSAAVTLATDHARYAAYRARFTETALSASLGDIAGFTRTIGQVVGATAYPMTAFIYPVTLGDQFEALPGCDHTIATCQGVFNNLARFGGFPYIPPPELAV